MMVDKKLTMADIAEKINAEFDNDLTCIFNDDNAEKLILRIRIVMDDEAKGDDGAASDDAVFLKRVESNMLTELALRGIPDIKKVFIREAKRTRYEPAVGFETKTEWMLDTEGVNLLEVMCHEEVDYRRVQSNHLCEVIEVLGIEATRNSLLRELRNVIEFDGSYVNYRHLAILTEIMTYRGHMMSITRHGINRNDTGPMMRCTFEETVDILNDAAAFAEKDDLKGISQCIMLGQLGRMGTGEFGIVLNEKMLEEAIEVQLSTLDGGEMATPHHGGGAFTPHHQGSSTPGHMQSPSIYLSPRTSPFVGGSFSPGPGGAGGFSPGPGYSPSAGGYSPTSPRCDAPSFLLTLNLGLGFWIFHARTLPSAGFNTRVLTAATRGWCTTDTHRRARPIGDTLRPTLRPCSSAPLAPLYISLPAYLL